MSRDEIGEWDFKAGKTMEQASLFEKIRLGLTIGTVPLMTALWVPQYYLSDSDKKLSAYLRIKGGVFVGSHSNVKQLRVLMPPRPLREELNGPLLNKHRHKFNNYNKIFHVNNASARWIHEIPDRRPEDPVIYYLHGGAYFLTTVPMQIFWLMHLIKHTKDLRISVLELDYTVSPQGRFPVQLDEALATYQELSKSCNKIITLGDSAGGHLALTLQDYLHRHNMPKPFGSVLLSPWADLVARDTGSFVTNASRDYIFPDKNIPLLFCTPDQLNDPKSNPCRGDAQYWAGKFDNTHVTCVWGEYEILADVCKEIAEKIGCKDTFVQPKGLHDAMILNPKGSSTDFIIKMLSQWLTPGRPVPPIPVDSKL